MSAPVGIVILGHGSTASGLLRAATGIAPGALEDVVAVDAGTGETPELGPTLCDILATADHGRGVLLIVDLLGASPWGCARREAASHHDTVVLSGLNLAMLLKLASLDRGVLTPGQLAREVASSAHRSVTIGGSADDQEEG